MTIEEERFVITFNGEIYNYLELQDQLKTLGYSFKTKGDTEVVLRAYQHWGKECVQKFRGMFSFAIADATKKELFIARDHFGIKPLLYYTGNSCFMFGSEIQQFKKHPNFEKNINISAVAEYFKFGYIPAPLTIYENLHKLEPRNYLRVDFRGKIIEKKEYYDIQFRPDHTVSYNNWVARTEEAINRSVNYHKIADVPYGTFLSGGIDSSLIASSLAIEGSHVDAFTMGFHNEKFDEVSYAKQVAEKYHLNHHIKYLDMQDMQDVLPKLIQHYGEPFADSSAIPTYYITKKIREYLPVVLSGDGGDEAFGGYYSYQNFLKIARPDAPKYEYKNRIKSILKYVGKTYPNTPRTPNLGDWIDLVGRFTTAKTQQIFCEDIAKNIDAGESIYKKWYDKGKSQHLDTYSLASYLDYKTYIHGDILTKVDIASMMNSLEVRTPLIDIDIVKLMARIPSKYKISRNYDGSWEKKKILNSIAEKRFGKSFVKRKKMGFSVPLEDWFHHKTNFGNEFEKIIKNKHSEIYKYLNYSTIHSMFVKTAQIDYNQVYLVYALQKWLTL